MSTRFRKATPKDSFALTDLTFRSKATWGYSNEFMEKARPLLAVTEGYLSKAAVSVMEVNEKIVGFVGLSLPEKEKELEFLFVEPEYLGSGFGKKLWKVGVEDAKTLRWEQFRIISDPNAEAFYLRMGARVGEILADIGFGRKLPLLRYNLL